MKKTLFRALLTGVAFVIVFYGVQIIGGIYMTQHYVPDIVEQYASVDYLQKNVTVGWVDNTPIWAWLQVWPVMLAGVASYYLVRLLKRKLSK
ncbi:hypothetical protein ABEW34_01990 [Paenibacillus algorifonticola]|uniref:hypothetical protein n=1 Tax=Paenibacillus algorifonticola TaxID=684063 RepID=UPI003D2E00A1